MKFIKGAPVVFTGLVQALLLAVLLLLQVFNVFNPTTDQQAAIMGVYVALVAISLFVIYGNVTPVVKAAADKQAAVNAVLNVTGQAPGWQSPPVPLNVPGKMVPLTTPPPDKGAA